MRCALPYRPDDPRALREQQNTHHHKHSITADETNRLDPNPPSPCGFVNKSPIDAPSGRVKINAIQKRTVLLIFVKK
jgi:hypothetical protein